VSPSSFSLQGPHSTENPPILTYPRPETESYILHLASLLSSDQPPHKSLSILDLCTGTGCIPLLLLHSLLNAPTTRDIPISLHGIDISPTAIALARANLHHNTTTHPNLPTPSPSHNHSLTFSQHDIFSPTLIPHTTPFLPPHNHHHPLDLLISNPPYISPHAFNTTTARAVRNHEPKLALVPPPPGTHYQKTHPADVFYARLLDLVGHFKPRRVLMEVGSLAQAVRVVQLAEGSEYGRVEIWRDEPSAGDRGEREVVAGRKVVVRGEGRGRAVYLERVGG
jgi:HemK-like putative methylase